MRAALYQIFTRSMFCMLLVTQPALAMSDEPADDPPAFPLATPQSHPDEPPPATEPSPATEQPNAVPSESKPAVVFPRPGVPSPAFTRPIIEPQVTNQTRRALNFYGGYAARTTLAQLPRRTPLQASPSRPLYRSAKPFQTVYREPTVSPYLNLNRDEFSGEAVPSYLTIVRPQLEQNEVNRRQQIELQQLRGQLQSPSTGAYGGAGGGMAGPAAPARYMDTAQFYGGLRR